ncbi:hypothetical protein LWI28_025174 [Acer negundo]|uniref:CCHC-type domain-containing protein n=1 Tax=Acer negundo TaxID=4023 RepID=A0AAD5IX90_ACENE|nr:hypothetical protein LWI28_025174 [Acer negundo]
MATGASSSSTAVTVISSTSSSHDMSPFSNTIISINIAAQAPLKLTATNYRSWKLQFHTLLIGFDLMRFVDGKRLCPPETITTSDTTAPNHAHHIWVRQDQLLLNAILGSITPSIIPFIASAKTTHDAWVALANTYVKPSRGHIMHLKGVLTNITKGTQSITEYMQHAKSIADELAMLDAPENSEDLKVKILNGLGEEFKDISSAVRARDSAIFFEELHEKLLNSEALLKQDSVRTQKLPIIANFVVKPFAGGSPSRNYRNFNNNNKSHTQPSHVNKTGVTDFQNRNLPSTTNRTGGARPNRGFCQLCGDQGHTAKRCSVYNFSSVSINQRQQGTGSRPQWQPRANFATPNSSTPEWLLDSSALHHVTAYLNNLSLHSPYDGSDDIMIGDGSGLSITHSGSTHLPTNNSSFILSNVLCVPNMKQNLISVSKFCTSDQVTVEFSPFSFAVKDLHTEAQLLQGRTMNGVYEWLSHAKPESSPIIAFSSVKASLPDWHHRIGHPLSKIISSLVGSQVLSVISHSSSSKPCSACLCNKMHKLPFSISNVLSSKPLEVIYSDV